VNDSSRPTLIIMQVRSFRAFQLGLLEISTHTLMPPPLPGASASSFTPIANLRWHTSV
jgi:hypothetical protein